MKKYILISLLLLFPGIVHGVESNNSQQIFRLESYKYSEETNTYVLQQYGSAVYIEKDMIFTNAHVVLDYNEEPYGNYRICRTVSYKDIPDCFSIAELKYYDTQNDLAALKVKGLEIEPVKKSTDEINLGDIVSVYGFPSNGGETITYTEGKISGYQDNLYKIDANIDSGNSGGGVFNEEGELLGITVSASIGLSTLGNFIPLDTINDFETKEKEYNIKENTKQPEIDFLLNSKKYFEAVAGNSFQNDFLKIASFATGGFHISSYNQSIDNKYYELLLMSEDGTTGIVVNNSFFYGDVIGSAKEENIEEEFKKVMEEGVPEELRVNLKTKSRQVDFLGKEALISGMSTEDTIIVNALLMDGSEETSHMQNIVIFSDHKENKSFKKALKLLTSRFNFYDYKGEQAPKDIKFSGLTGETIGGFGASKNIDGTTLFHTNHDIEEEMEISNYSYSFGEEGLEDYTVSSLLKETLEGQELYYYMHSAGIQENSKGTQYLYSIIKTDETKNQYFNELGEKYRMELSFYGKGEEETVKTSILIFSFDTAEQLQNINDFIDTIEIDAGKYALELGDAIVGENIVSEPEFEIE